MGLGYADLVDPQLRARFVRMQVMDSRSESHHDTGIDGDRQVVARIGYEGAGGRRDDGIVKGVLGDPIERCLVTGPQDSDLDGHCVLDTDVRQAA
jgi:hypothetical protein